MLLHVLYLVSSFTIEDNELTERHPNSFDKIMKLTIKAFLTKAFIGQYLYFFATATSDTQK